MGFLMKVTFIFTLVYLCALAALKPSQLYFYYRAFSIQLKVWIYLVAGIVVVWGVIFTFIFIFLCDPVSQRWTLERIGHCMDQILVLKSLIMTNVLTDMMIIILPMWTVWQLQMRMTEKISLLGCFAIGLACVIIGIVRSWQIFVIDMATNFTGTSQTTFHALHRGAHARNSTCGGGRSTSQCRPTTATATLVRLAHLSCRRAQTRIQVNPYRAITLPWIELGDEAESNHDGSSQRELTKPRADATIRVSTNWEVTHGTT
ncbi:hypothetical protein B0H66DRAFT_619013 [Apodospora peruviana]|uniref:Rhodopsin domain-containing protein n=1 Tax=Apodospora peruviana TaxID=516989 RepID=A0AAE0IB20_9PEZI|nr:hypothetical protein B0H66DRAFT_619013 [Apodospora peruviana]